MFLNKMIARALLSLTLLFVAAGVSGCSFLVPSEPEFKGPVSLTVVDGNLAFVQCFAPAISVDFVNVSMDGQLSGTSAPVSREVLLAEANGSSEATLVFAESTVIGEPIDGLDSSISQDIELEGFSGEVSASVALGGPSVSAWVWFSDFDLRELNPGEFVYDDGTVSTDPCGMASAYAG